MQTTNSQKKNFNFEKKPTHFYMVECIGNKLLLTKTKQKTDPYNMSFICYCKSL